MQFLMQRGVRTGRAVYGERTAKYLAGEGWFGVGGVLIVWVGLWIAEGY